MKLPAVRRWGTGYSGEPNKTSPKFISEPQGKILVYFSMPQNDNNNKTVSQLTQKGRRHAIQSLKNANIDNEAAQEDEYEVRQRSCASPLVVVFVLVI